MTLVRFFDKLEDHVRGWLSHYPIFYGLMGGIGIVLFWRGVWLSADLFFGWLVPAPENAGTIHVMIHPWDGPLSFILGSLILLMTGLFVSNFIGNEIIISGLRGEKKLTEKTEVEVRTETGAIAEIQEELAIIKQRLNSTEPKAPRARSIAKS